MTRIDTDTLVGRAARVLANRRNAGITVENPDSDGPYLLVHAGSSDAYAYRVNTVVDVREQVAGDLYDGVITDVDRVTVYDLRTGEKFTPRVHITLDADGTFDFDA